MLGATLGHHLFSIGSALMDLTGGGPGGICSLRPGSMDGPSAHLPSNFLDHLSGHLSIEI